MSDERRRHARSRLLRRARIVFRRGFATVDCVVLDISPAGARLKVGAMLGFPDRFELRVENGPTCEAVVRYRTPDATGVEFVDERAA